MAGLKMTAKDCLEHSRHDHMIRDNADSLRSQNERIADNEKSIIAIGEAMKSIVSLTENIDLRLTELENKPAENWDMAVRYAVTALIGALFTIILYNFGIH